MSRYVMRTLLVPDNLVVQVRALADSFGPASQNMWRTECSKDGEPPATWWISSGLILDDFADMLPLTAPDENGDWVRRPYDPQPFIDSCVAAGLSPPSLETVLAIMSAVDVSEQTAEEALQRLGLQRIYDKSVI